MRGRDTNDLDNMALCQCLRWKCMHCKIISITIEQAVYGSARLRIDAADTVTHIGSMNPQVLLLTRDKPRMGLR